MELKEIENEIKRIKERNTRVEVDKAWEVSRTRSFILTTSTYLLVVILLFIIKNERPFINALIPTFGYFISFQSLPFFKRLWLKNKKPNAPR